jgi:hypothetical protein
LEVIDVLSFLAHGCHSRNKARMIEENGERKKKP